MAPNEQRTRASSEIDYDKLDEAEKVALTVAIAFPHCALKEILPKLFKWKASDSTYYRYHHEGYEELREKKIRACWLRQGIQEQMRGPKLSPNHKRRIKTILDQFRNTHARAKMPVARVCLWFLPVHL